MKVKLEMTQAEIIDACRRWLDATHPEVYDSNSEVVIKVDIRHSTTGGPDCYAVSAVCNYELSES